MEELERNIAILTLLANKTLEGSTKTALLFALSLMKNRLVDLGRKAEMERDMGGEWVGNSQLAKTVMNSNMPRIKIGNFGICSSGLKNSDGLEAVWIEKTDKGEGGSFDPEQLEPYIADFYRKFF